MDGQSYSSEMNKIAIQCWDFISLIDIYFMLYNITETIGTMQHQASVSVTTDSLCLCISDYTLTLISYKNKANKKDVKMAHFFNL